MNERLEQARQLARRIDGGWQPADVEAQLARLHARQARRSRRWMVAAPLVAAAAAAAIAVGVMRPRSEVVARDREAGDARIATRATGSDTAPAPVAMIPAPPAPVIAEPPAAPGVLSLGDGSVVTPLGKDSRLLARRVSDSDVVVALTGGGARFDVPERAARRFRAELGALALETHGAAFRVQLGRRQIEVAAERGQVSARLGAEAQLVAAGETRAFVIAPHDDAAPAVRDEPPPPPD